MPAYPDNVRSVAVEIKGAVSADSSDVLLRLAGEGVGIARLGELAVGRALRNGSLEPVLLGAQVNEGYFAQLSSPSSRY